MINSNAIGTLIYVGLYMIIIDIYIMYCSVKCDNDQYRNENMWRNWAKCDGTERDGTDNF